MSLIAELKRRKVFRIAAAYLVAGWVVIQVAATVAPQFGMPDWTPRLVTFLVMLGFPLALVLAWALEFGEDGVRVDRAGAGAVQHLGGACQGAAGAGDVIDEYHRASTYIDSR